MPAVKETAHRSQSIQCLVLQGLKLYFRVLEAMVRSESERKGRLSLTDLLTSRSFHTCLLACSFEVISAAYHMV